MSTQFLQKVSSILAKSASRFHSHRYVADKQQYFCFFLASASVATAPAPVTARLRWLAANESGHLKSHTRQRLAFHGTRDRPSGRLPCSSRRHGTSAADSARLITSLAELCREERPAALRFLGLTHYCIGIDIMSPASGVSPPDPIGDLPLDPMRTSVLTPGLFCPPPKRIHVYAVYLYLQLNR